MKIINITKSEYRKMTKCVRVIQTDNALQKSSMNLIDTVNVDVQWQIWYHNINASGLIK